MKKKALIVVNLAGFLHFLWNDISTLQEMGYEVSVAMNENSAAGRPLRRRRACRIRISAPGG